MTKDRSEVLQGTLDLMVLKTLDAMGPLHGYGVARRLEQLSEELLRLNEGTVYASLLRLAQQGWIRSEWGVSDNNRKAKFYSITRTGRRQLAREAENWERISSLIGRVLRLESQRKTDVARGALTNHALTNHGNVPRAQAGRGSRRGDPRPPGYAGRAVYRQGH